MKIYVLSVMNLKLPFSKKEKGVQCILLLKGYIIMYCSFPCILEGQNFACFAKFVCIFLLKRKIVIFDANVIPQVWPRPNKLLEHNKSTALIVSQHGQSIR